MPTYMYYIIHYVNIKNTLIKRKIAVLLVVTKDNCLHLCKMRKFHLDLNSRKVFPQILLGVISTLANGGIYSI